MKRLNVDLISVTCAVLALASPAVAQESVIYSFPNEDTGVPTGQLLLKGNALYGATLSDSTPGSVYELKKMHGKWTATTLYAFGGGSDGANPAAGPVADAHGVLYGVTASGGTYNGGTIFSLTKSKKHWTKQTLWNFGNTQTHDGTTPLGAIVMDASGAIYGTTVSGGNHNMGTVFKLAASGGVWTSTVLHSFAGGNDGNNPFAGVVMDSSGVLYGTTNSGGARNQGTVYALSPSGDHWSNHVIHFFGQTVGDGSSPGYGSLALDSKGDLYGTTSTGGTNQWGTVFELVPSGDKWKEETLHAFGAAPDGRGPHSGVVIGASGELYGTAPNGGPNFNGIVYQLVQSGSTWSENILTSFLDSGGDGYFPLDGVTIDPKSGGIYGATVLGGTNGWGAVYRIVQK